MDLSENLNPRVKNWNESGISRKFSSLFRTASTQSRYGSFVLFGAQFFPALAFRRLLNGCGGSGEAPGIEVRAYLEGTRRSSSFERINEGIGAELRVLGSKNTSTRS